MAIQVTVKQMGKDSKALSLPEGSTIRDLMQELSIDPTGKSYTVTNVQGTTQQQLTYILQDMDALRIGANNAAA